MKRTAFALIILILFTCSPLAAEQVEFRLTGNAGDGLLPGNVTPPTASDGSGGIGLTGILFDLDTNFLYLDFGWGSENGFSDLTGEVTNLHLHGPTPDPAPLSYNETGPLLINLATSPHFNSSPTGGGLVDFYFISNSDVDALLAGRFYINVHTEMYDMGEIRGYLVPVPEPGSAAVLGSLALLAASGRRRRSRL